MSTGAFGVEVVSKGRYVTSADERKHVVGSRSKKEHAIAIGSAGAIAGGAGANIYGTTKLKPKASLAGGALMAAGLPGIVYTANQNKKRNDAYRKSQGKQPRDALGREPVIKSAFGVEVVSRGKKAFGA